VRELPSSWTVIALGEAGSWCGGGTPSKDVPEFWVSGGVPWVSPKDMKAEVIRDSKDHITDRAIEQSAAKRVPEGSVLVVTRSGILAHTLPVAVTEVEVTVNQDLKALTPNESIEANFVAWALRASGHDILETCRKDGTTVASIEFESLRRYQLPLAPQNEQRRIVDSVDSYITKLDNAVASLERVQAKLKAYRASALKAAVEGRLVPTEASLARAEKRDYEPAEALLARILKERRRRWEEAELANLKAAGKTPRDDRWKEKYEEPAAPDTSALPKLPEGWCWASWPQVGFSQNGRAFPSAEYRDTGVRLLRPGNLHESGRVEWNEKNTRHLPERWASDHPSYLVGPGELVINLTAQSLADEFLGRVCVTAAGEHCLLNQRIARLTPVLASTRFVLWIFKSPWFRKFVAALNTGSLIQHMFTTQLEEFILPLPPLVEQEQIADEVERQNTIAELCASSAALSIRRSGVLRQAVLKWAFEGKLVDQDPTDEPAEKLLARIRGEKAAAAPLRQSRGRTAKVTA